MARDIIHHAVKNALIKEGWTITADPLSLQYEDVRVFVDLGAERVIAAERQGEKIAVEIKSFAGHSLMHDFELALGQYTLYLSFLKKLEPERKLHLAISHLVYDTFTASKAVQMLVEENKIPLIVVNIVEEEISQWIQS
jgi:hypothetical protein